MQTNSMKAHYLINLMKGFENIDGTKLYSITQVNDTIEFNATVVTYDKDYNSVNVSVEGVFFLSDMAYKVKATGIGSRKYYYNVKDVMHTIINHLASESNKQYQSDCTDSHMLTVNYYYNQLINAGATTAQKNQFDNESYNKSVNEIKQIFNTIMIDLYSEEVASTKLINNETLYTLEQMDFINDDNYIIKYHGTDYDKALETFATMHKNGLDTQLYSTDSSGNDTLILENYNSIDNIIKCNDMFLTTVYLAQASNTDIYNNNYTLTPVLVNKQINSKTDKQYETTQVINTYNYNEYDTIYFNNNNELDYTNKFYNNQYNMYKLILSNISNNISILSTALFKHVMTNSSCWITIINDNPFYNKGCMLVNLSISTINKPITCYVSKDIINKYTTNEDKQLVVV